MKRYISIVLLILFVLPTVSCNADLVSQKPVLRGEIDDIPIYGYGHTYILGQSPDFLPDVQLQLDNNAPRKKIKPKQSSQIKSNYIGAGPPRMLRSGEFDFQPYLPIKLIDGNPYTCWCSRGQNQPDVEPVWIRIDLAREETISSVVLVQRTPAKAGDPNADQRMMVDKDNPTNLIGCALPSQLQVKLSTDAWHWKQVFEMNSTVPDVDTTKIFAGTAVKGIGSGCCGDKFEVNFEPMRAKQIWIIANQLPRVEHFGHCFSIAEVQVLDENGRNTALATAGAGVTVSSTYYGLGDDRESHQNLWPVHWDLGLKWVRLGYHDDPFNWHWVEQEKGVYKIDPVAERAVDELIANGIEVVLCLNYGNWLYTKEGKRPWSDFYWEMYYDLAPAPIENPARQAFLNYVRFMVKHFKDRIKYWELWNEANIPPYWGGRHKPSDVNDYIPLAKDMLKVIRQEQSDAKIVLGSSAGWYGQTEEMKSEQGWVMRTVSAFAKDVDVVAFHPFYHFDPNSKAFREYPELLKEFKQKASEKGFTGQFWVTEFTSAAPYPQGWLPADFKYSEIIKAKCMAIVNVMHTSLGMVSIWNETWNGGLTWWDVGLMRNTFSADPHSPRQPQPAYYVMRTLCTVLDSFQPEQFKVEIKSEKDHLVYTLAKGNEKAVAVWLTGSVGDEDPAVQTDIIIPGQKFSKAIGVDIINGTEQQLVIETKDNDTVIKAILLKDWPLIIKLIP